MCITLTLGVVEQLRLNFSGVAAGGPAPQFPFCRHSPARLASKPFLYSIPPCLPTHVYPISEQDEETAPGQPIFNYLSLANPTFLSDLVSDSLLPLGLIHWARKVSCFFDYQ